MNYSVLLDTSFFIRLLNPKDPLHLNAVGYFKYFLEQDNPLLCSTISIAEYCVKGEYEDLPWQNLRVLPFNTDHAICAGDFANIVFKQKETLHHMNRAIIPNDSKLFAQAEIESSVQIFLTSDTKCNNMLNLIRNERKVTFDVVTIQTPYQQQYGLLGL